MGSIVIKAIHWTHGGQPYRVNVTHPWGELVIKAYKTPGGARRAAARTHECTGYTLTDTLD